MAWFRMVKRRQPSPGAMAFAVADFRITHDSAIGGGRVPFAQRNVLQPPQVMQGLGLPVAGLGGVIQGQLVGQPLFDLNSQGLPSADILP